MYVWAIPSRREPIVRMCQGERCKTVRCKTTPCQLLSESFQAWLRVFARVGSGSRSMIGPLPNLARRALSLILLLPSEEAQCKLFPFTLFMPATSYLAILWESDSAFVPATSFDQHCKSLIQGLGLHAGPPASSSDSASLIQASPLHWLRCPNR